MKIGNVTLCDDCGAAYTPHARDCPKYGARPPMLGSIEVSLNGKVIVPAKSIRVTVTQRNRPIQQCECGRQICAERCACGARAGQHHHRLCEHEVPLPRRDDQLDPFFCQKQPDP